MDHHGPDCPHISFPAHGSAVITSLVLSNNRLITASDDHSIHVYSPITGQLLHTLNGHDGGVWALGNYKDLLVSGSSDRSVRIWNLSTGKCTHVFVGHTSTVRCLNIVKPEWVDVEDENGVVTREKWPKRPLIVSASRDHSLRVWTLPRPDEPHYQAGTFGAEGSESTKDADDNPYHRLLLEGHDQAVRALSARGRTVVSGSYDATVRIWDSITGACRLVLIGHTQKVYCVVFDPERHRIYSSSMDGTVRIWSQQTGQSLFKLTGHTSLIGLLEVSPSNLVSAAADATLRVWNPDTGELKHVLAAHTGAITTFRHDDFKVLSGSDGDLKLWDIRTGAFVRNLLSGVTGAWQVVFDGPWCAAAWNNDGATFVDVWNFEKDENWKWETVEEEEVSEDESEVVSAKA